MAKRCHGVTTTEGVLGGKPHIEGYRVAVVDVVELLEEGNSISEAAERLEIPEEAVENARDFYRVNRSKIDQQMEDREELYRKLTGEDTTSPA
jgi:uncharacterized protein (DUF433 family)